MGYSIFEETMVEMAWPQVEKAAEEGAIVLLPTGVIEEHGPHMGLGVDTYCSHLLCRHVRQYLEEKGIRALIAPPYYWGINQATRSFPGSFTMRRETMAAALYDILASLHSWGFTHVFNINWHGDWEHNKAILQAVEEATKKTGIKAFCILTAFDAKRFKMTGAEPFVLIQKAPVSERPAPKFLEIHAESLETGIMAQYFPDQVDTGLAKTLPSTDLVFEDLMVWRKGGAEARTMTPLGYFGDPARFQPQAAGELIKKNGRDIADLIESFLRGEYKPPHE